ncbi:MarR family transcriptional regulator [Spirillospora sp. NPDC000708]
MAQQPAPAADDIDRDVCKLVHRFVQRLDVHVRRVAEDVGMTASQVVALRELSEPITARELAVRMACEASNATFVLDRLEAQDLIERRPHPTDRRAKEIVLTPAGERARAGVLDRLGAHSPLAALADDKQEALRDLLRDLLADD